MTNEDKLAEIEQWLIENRIDDVEIMVPDHAGAARGKAMPRKKFIEGIQVKLSVNCSVKYMEALHDIVSNVSVNYDSA